MRRYSNPLRSFHASGFLNIWNSQNGLETDAKTRRGHYVQVDIFSMDDVTALIDDVMERMDNAGFEYLSSEDLYEDDTQVYHRAIRYFYLEERR